jgi:hypothetical protein
MSRKITEAEGHYNRSRDEYEDIKKEVKELEDKLRIARVKLQRKKLYAESSLSLLEEMESEGN